MKRHWVAYLLGLFLVIMGTALQNNLIVTFGNGVIMLWLFLIRRNK